MTHLPRMPIDLSAADLPIGAIIRRTYKGKVYTVTVEAGLLNAPGSAERGWWRYRYRGRLWKTLSAIAYDITGDRYMSGNRFFRLRQRRGQCRKSTPMRLTRN